MTTREEYEYAAKAAGEQVDAEIGPNGELLRHVHWVSGETWNPVTDDGDAFRLMVACGIAVTYPEGDEIVRCWFGDIGNDPVVEPLDNDPLAATRLAVFRAAVEIGRGMK